MLLSKYKQHPDWSLPWMVWSGLVGVLFLSTLLFFPRPLIDVCLSVLCLWKHIIEWDGLRSAKHRNDLYIIITVWLGSLLFIWVTRKANNKKGFLGSGLLKYSSPGESWCWSEWWWWWRCDGQGSVTSFHLFSAALLQRRSSDTCLSNLPAMCCLFTTVLYLSKIPSSASSQASQLIFEGHFPFPNIPSQSSSPTCLI